MAMLILQVKPRTSRYVQETIARQRSGPSFFNRSVCAMTRTTNVAIAAHSNLHRSDSSQALHQAWCEHSTALKLRCFNSATQDLCLFLHGFCATRQILATPGDLHLGHDDVQQSLQLLGQGLSLLGQQVLC